MSRTLTAFALALTLGVAVSSPADARNRGGRVAAGVLGGLAAGVIIGSMMQRGYVYGPGYYPGPGYYAPNYYGPVYEYGPSYYGPPPYAYAPPVYVRPAPRSYRGGCWVETDSTRGYGYYRPCY